MTEDAELVIAAYGTTARISRSVINNLREQGHKVGLIRPITPMAILTQTLQSCLRP